MQLRDISFASPQENILFDEILFQLSEKHDAGQFLRFWESETYFVVLGRIGREEEDVVVANAQADRIPVLRRTSGGGTVVQGPGCLNYTLVLSKHDQPLLSDLRASYAFISGKIIEALAGLGVHAVFHPISDIATREGSLKFSGNAQRRGKNAILHHGTILYNFDLDKISQYLAMPKDVPLYRKSRLHKDFVTNIPINPAHFKPALAKAFNCAPMPQPLSSQEILLLKNYIK